MAYCNKFDFFCTFTFNPEKILRYDLTECRKKISNVFDNYKQRYSQNFKYLLVPEYHKDGAIHLHGLIAGIRPEDLIEPQFIPKRNVFKDIVEMVPNTPHYLDWPYYSKKLGHFSCSKIKSDAAVSKYIVKQYITKDLEKLPPGQQMYLCSKGLNRAELIFDSDDVPMFGHFQDFEFCKIQWQNMDFMYDQFGVVDALISDQQGYETIKEPVYEQIKL